MATCDTLEVDLSRVDINVTLEQYPCIDVEVLQPDIVIDIGTVANQGPKGDKGDAGVAGPPGNPGVAGPPGGQGLPGNAATVTAGTTTTGAPGTNASVINTGTSSAAVFAFTIPRGDVGPQGPSGAGTGDMLKSVYDTNSNNIVDAAESVPWTGVTGKPATFSPSPHASTHLSAGSDPIAIATSVLAGLCPAVDNTTIQVVASKLSAVSLAWTAITGKPSTFPPDSTAMLKSVYDTNADNIVDHAALADTAPWTGITGVPATFAPSAHQASHVTGTDQIPSVSTSVRGLMPQANNNPNAFYASDATQKQVTYAMLGGAQPGPVAHASTHVTGGTDVIVPASVSTAGLLKQLSGNTTDFVDGTNACQNLVNAVQPTIWSVRLRSLNILDNPTFEVDQRNVHTSTAAPLWLCDRWTLAKAGTMAYLAGTSASPVLVPGTNFQISSYYATIQLTTVQASLGAGDYLQTYQIVEGQRFRELASDVHSFSILAFSSVANLKFGVSFRDPSSTRSLTKLCSLGAANTPVLFQFPNLPVFPGAGTFTTAPGAAGLIVGITLAAGSTYTAPSNDVWNNGNFLGATGQSNFAGSAVNSTFGLSFFQHEPGPLCTTPIDCPFTQNYDSCLRYYQKSWDYATAVGTNTAIGTTQFTVPPAFLTIAAGPHSFLKSLAKIPTLVLYSQAGAANACLDVGAAVDRTAGAPVQISTRTISQFSMGTAASANALIRFHYTSDTGW